MKEVHNINEQVEKQHNTRCVGEAKSYSGIHKHKKEVFIWKLYSCPNNVLTDWPPSVLDQKTTLGVFGYIAPSQTHFNFHFIVVLWFVAKLQTKKTGREKQCRWARRGFHSGLYRDYNIDISLKNGPHRFCQKLWKPKKPVDF
jgi:hypothetical protein